MGYLTKLRSSLVKLHRDESGDVPVGTMLIIALVVLPLLFLLIYFRDDIVDVFKGQADKAIGTDLDPGK